MNKELILLFSFSDGGYLLWFLKYSISPKIVKDSVTCDYVYIVILDISMAYENVSEEDK